MNYADIVQPRELATAEEWLRKLLAALRGRPEEGLSVKCIHQGWGDLAISQSVGSKHPLCLNGQIYPDGLGTHSVSTIEVSLPKPGRRLLGLAGVDDNANTRGKIKGLYFHVQAGDKELWRSGLQTPDAPPVPLDVALEGRRLFTLRVTGPEYCGDGDWVDLRAELEDGSTIRLDQPNAPEHLVRKPCFGFTFDGKPSSELLAGWKLQEEPPRPADGMTVQKLTWTDPKTGLQAGIEIKKYAQFPVVEWLVRFKNTGAQDTPILENIQSLDVCLPLGGWLNYHNGDYFSADSYEPHRVKLEEPFSRGFAPEGGRPTNKSWPYYNVEFAPEHRRGVILAIGWSGQWASRFDCRKDGVRVTGGQELTHFKLHPGEEVRTPLSVMLFYDGGRVRGQNVWRRWMLAHNVPRLNGKLPEPFCSVCMGLRQSETTEKTAIDDYRSHGVEHDYWWMDAGWYPSEPDFTQTGTWQPDPVRFPNGIRAVSDYVHARGMKLVLWFEPERVAEDTWLSREHPEWLLSSKSVKLFPKCRLLNLGHPEARKWLTEHVDRFLTDQGIDLYRQDFNTDPLSYWRENDPPDRQGILEIRHVEGYLAFWTELRRRRPGMLIDSCASGGRRNDLETLRLGVPLLRSDFQNPQWPNNSDMCIGNQGHTWSLSMWIPYYGTGDFYNDGYSFRSHMRPAMGIAAQPDKTPTDWEELRRTVQIWREAAPLFLGDYYPLQPYSLDETTTWAAWQFHRPDLGAGMLQIFRRCASPYESASFRLRGLEPQALYVITDVDAPEKKREATGRQLMETGLSVAAPQQRQALIIIYRKIQRS